MMTSSSSTTTPALRLPTTTTTTEMMTASAAASAMLSPAEECAMSSNFTMTGSDGSHRGCSRLFDNVTCWPDTPAGTMAIVACPTHFDGFPLSAGNATRICYGNATWQSRPNYTQCLDWEHTDASSGYHNFVVRMIYYVGFSVSVVALSVALFLFIYFRNLRCLRNAIHCHLIVTFILKNLLWLKMVATMPLLDEDSVVHQGLCKLILTLFNYLMVTNFFWMLVEGLYLHTVIVWTFSVDRLRFWHYVALGWGLPGVFVIIWVVVKTTIDNNACWLPNLASRYDYIFIVPILAVLVLNLIFLASIVWVLVTKLRASQTSQNCLYRKATKATLILFPLLGLTYLLFLFKPNNDGHHYVAYINSVLQSTQGLFVAIFYCFLNVEVQATVKSRLYRWLDGRRPRMPSRTAVSVITSPEQASFPSGGGGLGMTETIDAGAAAGSAGRSGRVRFSLQLAGPSAADRAGSEAAAICVADDEEDDGVDRKQIQRLKASGTSANHHDKWRPLLSSSNSDDVIVSVDGSAASTVVAGDVVAYVNDDADSSCSSSISSSCGVKAAKTNSVGEKKANKKNLFL